MSTSLSIQKVRGMGRGVFAQKTFSKGEIIELCPVIPMKALEANHCEKTILNDYFFEWGKNGRMYAVALGFGSLYNYSDKPNATFSNRTRELLIVIRASREIHSGEQIFIDYNWPKKTLAANPLRKHDSQRS